MECQLTETIKTFEVLVIKTIMRLRSMLLMSRRMKVSYALTLQSFDVSAHHP